MAEHSRLIQELKETLANALKVQEAAQATIASQNARVLQQEAQITEACHMLYLHCIIRIGCCLAHADFPHQSPHVGC